MRAWIARLRFFAALVAEAWQESAGTGLRCELHPDRAFGHDDCQGAGLFRNDAIDQAVYLRRLERQRVRELNRLRAEAVVFYLDALRRATTAAALLRQDPQPSPFVRDALGELDALADLGDA